MKEYMKCYILASALGLVLIAPILYAQEEPYDVFWKPDTTEGINNGLVIAYGMKIPKPYYVTIRDDTVFVNNVAYYPYISPKVPRPSWTEEQARREQRKWQSFDVVKRYRVLTDLYGWEQAPDSLMAAFRDDERLRKIEFLDRWNFELTFKDSVKWKVDVLGKGWENVFFGPTDEESRALLEIKAESLRYGLQQGRLEVVSMNEYVSITSERADVIEKKLADIRKGILPKSEIISIFGSGHIADDIKRNIDSWEEE